MPPLHDLRSTGIGMVRIYVKPSDKAVKGGAVKGGAARGGGWSLWRGRPLYRALVAAAKEDGILNAVAHRTHYGYSNHGPVREDGVEVADPHLTMCVELIGRRDQLELFCRRHDDLLTGKVIVYKHLEQWCVGR